MKVQVRLVAPVDSMPERSSPSKLGLRFTKLASPSPWHSAQLRLSVRHRRT